jgi:dihydrofolate synthase / folylpolyglutamate synthase
VDIAVVEVGLGGRLDSTNVLTPLVSGVTKIAADHMKYLGDTVELIAREKAGIAKPGVPFVIGETRPELIAEIRTVALAARAKVGVLPAEYRWRGRLGLNGPFQRRNAAVAHGILMALPPRYRPDRESIERGFARARIPGRFDRRGKWLFDVAHNTDGMTALGEAIAEAKVPRPIHALVSILGDKAWPEMLVRLDAAVDRGVLTVAPTAAGRRWDMTWLNEWLRDPNRPRARAHWTLTPDFAAAMQEVQEGAATVLVTGSFHTVGDAMAALGMEP